MTGALWFGFAAALLWGIVYAIDERVLGAVSPATLFFVDAIATTVVVAPFAWAQRNVFALLMHIGWPILALLGLSLVLSAVASYCILSAIKGVGAPVASTIEIAYPMFVALISYIVFREQLKPVTLLGMALVISGAAIIVHSSSRELAATVSETAHRAAASTLRGTARNGE